MIKKKGLRSKNEALRSITLRKEFDKYEIWESC